MSNVATIDHASAPAKQPTFGIELKAKITQFSAALPKHIPQERFARVIMTAVQLNPDLLTCNRQSLWNAAMRAASDGLLPDGREGALVPYKGQVQWMPMIGGLRKKVRNSKELSDWHAQVVHAKDDFEYELGDDPFIRHKPYQGEGDAGPVIAAYSVATFRGSGDKSREVMTRAQLDKVRKSSKASKGPWFDWYEEMCRKTVARRHAKILPMSTDLDDLMRRDDELYDLKGASDAVAGSQRLSLNGKLDALAAMPDPEQDRLPPPDDLTEQGQDATVQADEASATGPKVSAQAAEGAGPQQDQPEDARAASSPALAPDDQVRVALLDNLRSAAMEGPRKLKFAMGKLSAPEFAILSDDDKAMLDNAAKAAGDVR